MLLASHPMPTLPDPLLAAVVATLALVPAALVFLALAALSRQFDLEERLGPNAYRALAILAGAGLAVTFSLLAWTWGGATHLKPRCLARGEPMYASVLYPGADQESAPAPVNVGTLLIDAPEAGGQPPSWAGSLLGPGRFAAYEWRRPDGRVVAVTADGPPTPLPVASAAAVLTVRRSAARSSYWATITVDRFVLTERRAGTVLAEGEEMWVDAGPARYRCGIASGPLPVRGDDYPAGDGVARFLFQAIRPSGHDGPGITAP